MTARVYLGGTFDPIHLAHVHLAKCAAQAVDAQTVSFVVSAHPPHKQAPHKQALYHATPEQRLAMVQLGVNELNEAGQTPVYVCEDCEFKRSGLSYTLDTVKHLREQHPEDDLYWVMGMDSYNSLNTWHKWTEITDHVNLIVANRPGETKQTEGAVADWAAKQNGIRFIEIAPMQLSSTEIRQKNTMAELTDVSQAVLTYIHTHGLYVPMTKLNDAISDALDDLKAQKVVQLEVAELTDIADHLIICNGTSGRHVKSLAKHVVEELKPKGFKPIGVEGLEEGEWVLVDYGDTVVHVMQPQTREFYELEKLWSKVPANRAQSGASDE